METNKVLSALCYFSIFFAGFLFPLIVYFVSDDQYVKKDAKTAFLSHLLPVIAVPLVLAGLVFDMGVFASGAGLPIYTLIMIGLAILISVVVVIWNVYKGIKVLL
ncbi:DUF4870 domain-containing protein [Rossellomorea sp. NPDC077527]|uniref:DUF4870 domain-containing protein n=1 Tax=Rossellomorea sp. NPDC077527 TaxID=3364510 RepID=UPI0037CA91EE